MRVRGCSSLARQDSGGLPRAARPFSAVIRVPMVLAILCVLAVRALTGAARVRVAVAHNLDVDPAGGGRWRARDLSAQHNPVGAARPQDLHSIACSTVGSASNAGAVEQEVTTQRRGQPDLRSEMRMRDAAREHA